jgi:hypothetical protein
MKEGSPRQSQLLDPQGVTLHPQSMMRSYFSRKYYNSPMPHAIFFYCGFAIHGTNDIARLGGPASHGLCQAAPVARGRLVRAGPTQRAEQHADRDIKLRSASALLTAR